MAWKEGGTQERKEGRKEERKEEGKKKEKSWFGGLGGMHEGKACIM